MDEFFIDINKAPSKHLSYMKNVYLANLPFNDFVIRKIINLQYYKTGFTKIPLFEIEHEDDRIRRNCKR